MASVNAKKGYVLQAVQAVQAVQAPKTLNALLMPWLLLCFF